MLILSYKKVKWSRHKLILAADLNSELIFALYLRVKAFWRRKWKSIIASINVFLRSCLFDGLYRTITR